MIDQLSRERDFSIVEASFWILPHLFLDLDLRKTTLS